MQLLLRVCMLLRCTLPLLKPQFNFTVMLFVSLFFFFFFSFFGLRYGLSSYAPLRGKRGRETLSVNDRRRRRQDTSVYHEPTTLATLVI